MKKSGVLKWKIKKKLLKIFIIPLFLIITLTLVYSFSPLVFAWVNPTVAPPGDNVDVDDCSNYLDFVCDCFPEDLPVGWHECAKKEIGEECGGGKVAYNNGSGGGIIVHSTESVRNIQWGCRGQSVGTTSAELGTGLTNTNTIIAYHDNIDYYGCTSGSGGTCVAKGCESTSNGTVAAKVCYDLSSGGYDDWYLPSSWELSQIYINRVAIGGLTTAGYWSSTEKAAWSASGYTFSYGSLTTANKDVPYWVRCIRTF